MERTLAKLPVITLQPVFHRNSQWILITGEDVSRFNSDIRKISGRKYSATYHSWLLPWSRESYNQLMGALQAKAIINSNALKVSLRRQVKTPAQSATSSVDLHYDIAAVNKDVLPQMLQHLQLKGYSESTIRTYMNEMGQFLKAIKEHQACNFNTQRLKDYLQYCQSKLHLSENTIHSRMNALKFYYEQVLKREKLFWEIPRPKKAQLLPKLLNETEIARLFNALQNKKHKAMLFLAYSAGLRVSEIVSLKIADIDSKRMQIFVARAKGKKIGT